MTDMKEAVSATARLFWIYQAFALAAALLAFLPDRSATYTQSISELRRLADIKIRADEVDAALAPSVEKTIGYSIFDAVDAAAKARGLKLASNLKANATYMLIDKGPQTLSFDETKIGNLLDALKVYARNTHYVVLVPEPNALKVELLEQFADTPGVVTSFSISCNYAPDRCRGDVEINPNGDMTVSAQRVVQFFVPRIRVEINFGTLDLVSARYPTLGADWLEAPALEQMRDALAELAPAAAIAKLQDLRKAEDRPISIFDVSLSGSAARLVAPMVLAILSLTAWASASGLKRLGASAGVHETMFLPLIRTPPATIVRWGCFWFPLLVGQGLLIRSWNTGRIGCFAALFSLVVQSWATLEMFGIFADLRDTRALRATGWRAWIIHAFVAVLVLTAVGWSLVAAASRKPAAYLPTQARPNKKVLGHEARQAPDEILRNQTKTNTSDMEDDAIDRPAKLPEKISADVEREERATDHVRAAEDISNDESH